MKRAIPRAGITPQACVCPQLACHGEVACRAWPCQLARLTWPPGGRWHKQALLPCQQNGSALSLLCTPPEVAQVPTPLQERGDGNCTAACGMPGVAVGTWPLCRADPVCHDVTRGRFAMCRERRGPGTAMRLWPPLLLPQVPTSTVLSAGAWSEGDSAACRS